MSRPSPRNAEASRSESSEAVTDRAPSRWTDFNRLTLGGEISPRDQHRIYVRLADQAEGEGGLILAKNHRTGQACQLETVHRLGCHRSRRQLYGHLIQALAVCHGLPSLREPGQAGDPSPPLELVDQLEAAIVGQSGDSWPADDLTHHRHQADRHADDLLEAARASWNPLAWAKTVDAPRQLAWRGSLRSLAVFHYGQAWNHRLQAESLRAGSRRQLLPETERDEEEVWSWDRALASCSDRERFLADQIYRLEIPPHLKAKYWQRLASETRIGRVMTNRIPRRPDNLSHYEQQLLLADFYTSLSQSWSSLWIDQANAVSTASLTNSLQRPGFDRFLSQYQPETMVVDSPQQFLDRQADGRYHQERHLHHQSERLRIETLMMILNRLELDKRPGLANYDRLVRRQQVRNPGDVDQLDQLLAQAHQQQLLAQAKLHFGLELSHQAQAQQLDWAESA